MILCYNNCVVNIVKKTNVLRILEKEKIAYDFLEYDNNMTDAVEIAKKLNQDPQNVFKTLVTVGKKSHYVFMVPSNQKLNLKKAAFVVDEKSIKMIKQKDLKPLTGYVHGGCSPIGMKTNFPTYIDETCMNQEIIYFSGGRVGLQVKIKFNDFKDHFNIEIASLC